MKTYDQEFAELDLDDEDEDFDSEDLDFNDSDEGDDYLASMWDRYSFRSGSGYSIRSQADDLVTAYGMVKTITKVFARNGEQFAITFDPKTKTAASDLRVRRIVLTPSPVLDKSLSARTAGLILTGLACHEVSHFRYGLRTAAAVRKRFGDKYLPNTISNVLDDVRIERRFVHEYPGYAGIFDPLLEYVAQSNRSGSTVLGAKTDPLSFAIAAVRFDRWHQYTNDALPERAWWRSWTERWAKHDSPSRHVEGVREALEHIAAQAAKNVTPKPKPTTVPDLPDLPLIPIELGEAESDPEGEPIAVSQGHPEGSPDAAGESPGDTQSDGTGESASIDEPREETPFEIADTDEEELPEEWRKPEDMTDEEVVDAASDAVKESREDDWVSSDLPGETDDTAVDKAARGEGVSQHEIDRLSSFADQIIIEAEGKESGVWVSRTTKGVHKAPSGNRGWDARYSQMVKRSGITQRYVRDALMRERTSRKEITHFQKRGHLDGAALHRVPMNDLRCFQRRRNPSPQNRLVWMLIDCSSSMGASVAEAASVAMAFAEASQHVRAVRFQVWAWTDGLVPGRTGASAVRFWSDGEPISKIKELADVSQQGTPDAPVMGWARKAILRELRVGEKGMILMCSDGAGYGGVMTNEIDEGRSAGLDIKGIALGSGMREHQLAKLYGPAGYVAWQGTIEATAKPLAKLLARSLSVRQEVTAKDMEMEEA